MSAVVRISAPGVAEVVQEAERPLGPDQVRLATLFSGISAGTELTAYRGSNPYLSRRWDEATRLFVEGSSTLEYPVDGWGYEEVGEIVELGAEVDDLKVGTRVWGTWGHRSTTVQSAAGARRRVLDPAADPRLGIFSEIGAIGLNVALDADIHVGETVAVFGLGVPGQITAQVARLNGARVIGVDAIAGRRALARELGVDVVLDATTGDVAEQVHDLTGGRGADVCLEVTGNYRALHEAVRSVAYNSRVVVAGFMQGEGLGLRLGEEFHHNRVQLVCSQAQGISASVQHRWDHDRLARTAMDLAVAGRLRLLELISHTVPVAQAPEAFRLLNDHPEQAVQVVLSFDPADADVAA